MSCASSFRIAGVWLTAVLAVSALAGGEQKPPKKEVTPAVKADPLARVVPWTGKLEDARALSKERNVPILIHVILEDEEASDKYRDTILPDKDLITASAPLIVIISNNSTHEKKVIEEVVDGVKVRKEVCKAFGVASCAHHQATWDDIYNEYKEESGDLNCPQTIVLAPDGKVSARINTHNVPNVGEILGAIAEAKTNAGPGLTDAQLVAVKKLLESGRNLMNSKSWPDAWKTWAELLAITAKSPYAVEALAEQPKALAAMQAELDRISALLVPGTAADAYKQLVDFGKTCAATPLDREIQARIKKAETTKGIKDEIAAWKLGGEADALLREARDLYDQKQDKKAELVVKRLFAKRYAGTAAAKIARELWPDLVPPPDDKPPPK